MDGLTYPAEIIRMHANVDSSRELEVVETAMTFSSEDFAPPPVLGDRSSPLSMAEDGGVDMGTGIVCLQGHKAPQFNIADN
jgi:hypothetical protein